MERWKVAFYTAPDGRKPVEEFLDELEKSRPDDAAKLYDKFRILQNIPYSNACSVGLIKPLPDTKICSLKVKGTGLRILMFTWRGRTGDRYYMLASHDIKQSWKLSDEALRSAEDAREDWVRRHDNPKKGA